MFQCSYSPDYWSNTEKHREYSYTVLTTTISSIYSFSLVLRLPIQCCTGFECSVFLKNNGGGGCMVTSQHPKASSKNSGMLVVGDFFLPVSGTPVFTCMSFLNTTCFLLNSTHLKFENCTMVSPSFNQDKRLLLAMWWTLRFSRAFTLWTVTSRHVLKQAKIRSGQGKPRQIHRQ